MSNEELKATIQDIHESVYQQGYEQGATDMEKAKQIIIDELHKQIETLEADGCEGCAFISTEEWEMPCVKCKRNCKDYWRTKK